MNAALKVEVSDSVAVLTLNRPEKLNAYTAEMGRLLGVAYQTCDANDAVRAIVLTGAGSAFCAGADFSGEDPFGAPSGEFTASPIRPAAFDIRKPVIAAVNGHAIGIGLTIALQADIRVVAEDARCGVVQVRRGVIPDCMAHWTIAHLAGLGVAADLLLTGRTFLGREAPALGLARSAVPAECVLSDAVAIATDIAENVAPMSAALRKRLLWDTVSNGYTPQQVVALETALHRRVMRGADAREGMAALVERRAPRWSTSVSAEWTELPDPQGH